MTDKELILQIFKKLKIEISDFDHTIFFNWDGGERLTKEKKEPLVVMFISIKESIQFIHHILKELPISKIGLALDEEDVFPDYFEEKDYKIIDKHKFLPTVKELIKSKEYLCFGVKLEIHNNYYFATTGEDYSLVFDRRILGILRNLEKK